jgi:hypothetical protein
MRRVLLLLSMVAMVIFVAAKVRGDEVSHIIEGVSAGTYEVFQNGELIDTFTSGDSTWVPLEGHPDGGYWSISNIHHMMTEGVGSIVILPEGIYDAPTDTLIFEPPVDSQGFVYWWVAEDNFSPAAPGERFAWGWESFQYPWPLYIQTLPGTCRYLVWWLIPTDNGMDYYFEVLRRANVGG